MHIAEVVTIAKSLPLLRLNTYKSLILSYSADYRRIFRKNHYICSAYLPGTHCFCLSGSPARHTLPDRSQRFPAGTTSGGSQTALQGSIVQGIERKFPKLQIRVRVAVELLSSLQDDLPVVLFAYYSPYNPIESQLSTAHRRLYRHPK